MNFAHLTSFQAIEFMDWPVPKTLDIFVCQTSENKPFTFCNCCAPVVRGEEREHDLISSPAVSTHYDHHSNVGRNESSSSENPLGN